MHNAYNVGLLRAWKRRREARGFVVTSDEIWARIKTKWPKAEEWQQEWLFQAV